MTPWEVIEPGEHKFPFALKVKLIYKKIISTEKLM